MSIENTFEEIFYYYRSDPSIRDMFRDLDLLLMVKFADTKQKYFVTIKQDQSIFLNPAPEKKPDIKVRVSSEQLLKDLVNGALPVPEQFKKGKIMITKGLMKIIKIYRKYIGDPEKL